MSAGAVLQAAAVAALGARGEFGGVAVFDAAPVRAAVPYAVVEDPVLLDWSTKTWAGREARLTVLLHDAGERPLRVRALADAVAEAVGGLAGDPGEAWSVATVRLVRVRVAKGPGDRWIGASEFVVRMVGEG